jgi:PAS domain S-box-containing protein
MDEREGAAASTFRRHDAAVYNLLRLATQAAPSGLLAVDPAGTIVFVNPALERLFGYESDELIGQAIEVLLPEEIRPLHLAHRRGYSSEPQRRPMGGAGRELWGRHKNGTQVAVEVGLNPMQTTDGKFVVASVVDVSERRRHEDERRRALHERIEFESLVAELAATFVNVAPELLDQSIEDALQRIVEALDVDRSSLYQLSADGGDFVLTHNWARVVDPPVPALVSVRAHFPWSTARLRKGQPASFSSLDEVPDASEREALRYFGTRSRIAFPLYIDDRLGGALSFATVRKECDWPAQSLTVSG